MIKEIENKIGQLQYEISCLGLDKEDLTGVSIRTEELKSLVKKLTIPDVSDIVRAFEEWQKKYPLVNLEEPEWQLKKFLSEYYCQR